ncbi:hypothetical protein BJF78_07675 [Pseudonocardia sp. CNS-139]|nr:hypothetical protein BJF78_07675 [Pseudonocardia sp. CNS-139]
MIVLPAGLAARPMRSGDAATWAALLQAVEAADRRAENYDEQDCAEELADPDVDLGRDTTLVLDAAGAPVAYQVLRTRAGAGLGTRVIAEGAVHPAHRRRGVGAALLGLARRRAEAVAGSVEMRVAETNAGASRWPSGPG